MRDFETLVAEAEALQSDEERRAWLEGLTLEERLVFLQKWDPTCFTWLRELWESSTGLDWEARVLS